MSVSELFDFVPVETFSLQRAASVYFVAKVGINHNGDVEIAKELISLAKEAGCDAVKFQKRDIDVVYSPDTLAAFRESPWGATQRDQKEGLEFGQAEYEAIQEHCRDLEIDWSASAWDENSLQFIEAFQPRFHKVASAMITNLEFLSKVAGLKRPTMLSTGMSTLEQIDQAVKIFRESGTPFLLLHTVSTYPTDENLLNLSAISHLRSRYGVNVGYSGHESSVSPSVVAAALGAVVIERHVTLDRAMYGSDQAASLEPAGLRQVVAAVKKVPTVLGDGLIGMSPGEEEVAAKLRYWQ